VSLADHERRLHELERYLPNLERLREDQEFRDRIVEARGNRWRFYGGMLGALAACATLGIAVAAFGSFLIHLF
jgi:hypothetical protein